VFVFVFYTPGEPDTPVRALTHGCFSRYPFTDKPKKQALKIQERLRLGLPPGWGDDDGNGKSALAHAAKRTKKAMKVYKKDRSRRNKGGKND